MPQRESDISLAIRIDDISLLESVFRSRGPVPSGAQSRMLLTNPEHSFSTDRAAGRLVMRGVVSVEFSLVVDAKQAAGDGKEIEVLGFGTAVGVVASAPLMGDALAARHMSGPDPDAEARRDTRMEHALRLEAIRAGHSFASAKLTEMSALSPTGTLALPLIDADELLHDIEASEMEGAPVRVSAKSRPNPPQV